MCEIHEKWKMVRKILKQQNTALSYKVFIQPLHCQNVDDDARIIYLSWANQPNLFDHLKLYYFQMIDKAVKDVWGSYTTVIKLVVDYEEREKPCFVDEVYKPNPLYSFENFVVGDSNGAAFNAARVAGEFPGGSYNPLFIYGDSGLGKTHLLHAIGGCIKANDPALNVMLLSSGNLSDMITEAAEYGRSGELDKEIHRLDVLLIDDIQFLRGQDAVQEMLLKIIEYLYNNQKQVVITGDYVSVEMMGIDIRLREKFCGCKIAEIKSPSYETKKRILMNMAKAQKMLPDEGLTEVIEAIARESGDSGFELQGMIRRIEANSRIIGTPIDLNNCRELIDSISGKHVNTVSDEDEAMMSPTQNHKIINTIRNLISKIVDIMN